MGRVHICVITWVMNLELDQWSMMQSVLSRTSIVEDFKIRQLEDSLRVF